MPSSKRKIEDDSEEEVYHVEVITRARVALPSSDDEEEQQEKGPPKKKKSKFKTPKLPKWEYYVKWANYDSDSNSWEPAENVAGCQRLLASFWKHVGTDNEDYSPGYEVAAEDKWIKQEKRYFQKEYNDEKEKRERHRRKKMKKTTTGESSRRSATTKSRTNSLAMDNSEDDKPLLSKRKLESGHESSDDDIPLSQLPPRKALKSNSLTNITPDSGPSKDGQYLALSSKDQPSSLSQTKPLPAQAPPMPLPPLSRALPLPVNKPASLPPLKMSMHQAKGAESPGQISSGSGLSTKHRLSMGALAPRPPKAMPPPPTKFKLPSSAPRTASSSLMPLSFKKKTASTPVISTGGSFAEGDGSGHDSPHRQETTSDVPTSPDRNYHDTEMSCSTLSPLANNTHAETEAFLREIMPPDLAGPLKPAVERPFEPRPPQPLVPKQFVSLEVAQKPWTWTGNVFIEEHSEPAFGATLCDATPLIDGGLRFTVALATKDHLTFSSFHDAVDLDAILAACQGVHQFSRLGPRQSADVEPFGILTSYMTKMQKVILSPVHLDGLVVGHIVFFHHCTHLVTSRLKPPHEIRKDKSLVAALIPWVLTPRQLMKHHRRPPNDYIPLQADVDALIKDESQWVRTVRTRFRYQHALRALKFPRSLYTYLSEDGHVRTFCLWLTDGDETSSKATGLESTILLKIMEKCRTRHVSPSDKPRLIFIHAGAVKSLHKFPGLLDICSASTSMVQFYTYGTHETVAPQFWGIREIYPCGGIVTFTPQALLDDASGVVNRINQIYSHPMWECYIIPSVLGMVAKIYSQRVNGDPVAIFDSGKFPYAKLLSMIDDGELSLISSPSDHKLPPTTHPNPPQAWVKSYWTHRPHGPRAILQSCLDAFNNEYGAIRQIDWTSRIRDEVSNDLRAMRSHPVFMGQYRRYIVLDSSRTREKAPLDALEWTTPMGLEFKDDFFPIQ